MRIKTNERRSAIIDAATELFREEGYERASMDGIARKAGGSKATLYGYFKSKEELFVAAMTAAVESAVVRISPLLDAESEDLQTVLERVAAAYLDFIVSDKILAITRAVVGHGSGLGLGPTMFEQGPKRGVAVMASYFAEQMRRGRLRNADPTTAALHFIGLVKSDHLEAALYRAKPCQEGPAVIADAVSVFLAAYQPERSTAAL